MARRSVRQMLIVGLGALLFGSVPRGPARAQAIAFGAPLDRLNPAPAGDAFFAIPSADVPGRLRAAVSLGWSFAQAPLSLRTLGKGAQEVNWVGHQMLLHTMASVELVQRFKLELDVPFTLHQGGTSGALAGIQAVSPSGARVNDVRAGGRAVLLRQDGYFPAAAVSLSVFLPSGNPEAFTGSGTVRVEPAVILGAEYTRVRWALSFGRRFQPETPGVLFGSQITFGAAVAARFGPLSVGPEVFLSAGAGDRTPAFIRDAVSAEALLGAHYSRGPFMVGLGGGPGLGRAPGTPRFRLFASVGAAIEFNKKPAAAPAAPSAAPRLPTAPPTAASSGASGASDPVIAADRDGDTVPDVEDACPTIAGDPSPGAIRRGCPKDRDRDGIFDVDDHCPDEPGVLSLDPSKNGCPLDSDGDEIPDTKDACPKDKGEATDDPKTNGCPTKVRVEGTQIVILQQVNFETGSDEIKKDSFDLLGQVAAVMKDHPEIARVAVDGHTDNVGRPAANLTLSQRRAVAVVRWLADHGVDARRLEARGFGPRRPIADNKTDAGKAKNRRVEFLIRRRSPEGEAGWRDGPVD